MAKLISTPWGSSVNFGSQSNFLMMQIEVSYLVAFFFTWSELLIRICFHLYCGLSMTRTYNLSLVKNSNNYLNTINHGAFPSSHDHCLPISLNKHLIELSAAVWSVNWFEREICMDFFHSSSNNVPEGGTLIILSGKYSITFLTVVFMPFSCWSSVG